MDRYRPRYHFTPLRNWMNDPNGPFQRDGEYHLFYQHNPSGTEWGDIHWGHATSLDLVNWKRLPVALAPSRELGELHCYSGCSVVNGDEVTLFYTSIGEGERNATTGAQQWTAKGNDLRTWRKPAVNPILTVDIHGDLRITEWRDPYVWRDQEEWKMLLGGT
ncbi:glycoside hydrolase family 32 protein [Cohnella thermotolerans]|uniref:glycoside hydrolase family 32 protein n=1 Tax=Cohnella thermotolerans TaxID=329858 RepID=UPI0004291640|nr:glycoside hydrolase family 32 protein [Cohnella thermotolerans]